VAVNTLNKEIYQLKINFFMAVDMYYTLIVVLTLNYKKELVLLPRSIIVQNVETFL
jgi:hypothetical protein